MKNYNIIFIYVAKKKLYHINMKTNKLLQNYKSVFIKFKLENKLFELVSEACFYKSRYVHGK